MWWGLPTLRRVITQNKQSLSIPLLGVFLFNNLGCLLCRLRQTWSINISAGDKSCWFEDILLGLPVEETRKDFWFPAQLVSSWPRKFRVSIRSSHYGEPLFGAAVRFPFHTSDSVANLLWSILTIADLTVSTNVIWVPQITL